MDRTRSAGSMAIKQARPHKWLSPSNSPLDAWELSGEVVPSRALAQISSASSMSWRADSAGTLQGLPLLTEPVEARSTEVE